MRFTVWGARGSHPVPLTPQAIRSKIATVVQRIRPGDLISSDSRERFLASLPLWLFGTTSGNTACVQLELDEAGRQFIFDAGSGIIGLGSSLAHGAVMPTEFHIFFTHFHYDHVQGLPFFMHAYNPTIPIHFYSPLDGLEAILSRQMHHPYFPVTMEDRMSNLHFHRIAPDGVELYGALVHWRELNHPGRAFGYRVDYGERSFAYVTDVELQEGDFKKTAENARFFQDVDAMILDTQYTLDEAIEKYNWGHSSFSLGVDFAVAWGVRRLFMFHHEPKYDDKKLDQNLNSARWYANRSGGDALEIDLAREGITIDV